MDCLDPPVMPDLRDCKESKVRKEQRELQVLRGQPVLQVPKARLERQARQG